MLPWEMKSLRKKRSFLHIILMLLLASLLIILTLILIVLLLPLTYKLDVHFLQPGTKVHFSIGNCCYGLQADRQAEKILLQLSILGFKRPLKRSSSAKQTLQSDQHEQPAPGRKKSFSPSMLKMLAQDHGMKNLLIELVKNTWHIIRPKEMLVKTRIGFSEPHYTGWLMAVAGALQAANNCYQIQLEGVWDEPCLEGELRLSGRLIPVLLIWQFINFALKPEVRLAYKQFRSPKSPTSQQAAA